MGDMERMVALDSDPTKVGLLVAFGLGIEDMPELAPAILVQLSDGTEEMWQSDLCHARRD